MIVCLVFETNRTMKTNTQRIDASKWMDNYYQYLKNYAFNRVQNLLDVEELIQETFLAGLKSKDNFQNRSSERTWLTAILKNKIIDYYRRKSSKKGQIQRRMISHDEYNIYLKDAAFTAVEDTMLADLECKELQRLLKTCIDTLPNASARVARLKIYDNLSTEEISSKLNISRSNVWVCMHRARTSIAKQLDKYNYAV